MLFSFVVTALLSSVVVNAADILVKVGANDSLIFDPSNITAQAGDTISFQFQGKNHSVTQSTFADPCALMTTPTMGVNSGFMFVAANATSLPQWSITVNNSTTPLWFFCAQTNPLSHCEKGMVFSVNAPAAKTFAMFQAAAEASGGNTTTGASSSGSASTPSSTGSSSKGSGSSASGTSGAASTSTTATSGAIKLGGSAAGALTAAALFVSFVL